MLLEICEDISVVLAFPVNILRVGNKQIVFFEVSSLEESRYEAQNALNLHVLGTECIEYGKCGIVHASCYQYLKESSLFVALEYLRLDVI